MIRKTICMVLVGTMLFSQAVCAAELTENRVGNGVADCIEADQDFAGLADSEFGQYVPFDTISQEHIIDLTDELVTNDGVAEISSMFGEYSKYSCDYFYQHFPTRGCQEWWEGMVKSCDSILSGNQNCAIDYYGDYVTDFVALPKDCGLQMVNIVNMFRQSNPQYYFLKSYYVWTTTRDNYYLGIKLYFDFGNGAARRDATNAFFGTANEWLSHVTASTDEGKMKQIHDLVCQRVSYNFDAIMDSMMYKDDKGYFHQSAYSSLMLGKTVCAGYSLVCVFMCNAVGIPAIMIDGTGNGGKHAWNEVCIDGEWYNMDITWDDEAGGSWNYRYYADSDHGFNGHQANEEFERLRPKCNSTKIIPKDETEEKDTFLHLVWQKKNGKYYWYENNQIQGTSEDKNGVLGDGKIRGREIYDPADRNWYWLDACFGGAKACEKEVWMPYIYQGEENWTDAEIREHAKASGSMANQVYEAVRLHGQPGAGKWVRYDSDGRMIKGWYTVTNYQAVIYPHQAGNTYYYDNTTGLMAKGIVEIDGKKYHFDEKTGVLMQ